MVCIFFALIENSCSLVYAECSWSWWDFHSPCSCGFKFLKSIFSIIKCMQYPLYPINVWRNDNVKHVCQFVDKKLDLSWFFFGITYKYLGGVFFLYFRFLGTIMTQKREATFLQRAAIQLTAGGSAGNSIQLTAGSSSAGNSIINKYKKINMLIWN